MRGYWIAFSIVCATNIVLQLLGKISAVPPTIALALIALLTFFTWRSLFKVKEEESD